MCGAHETPTHRTWCAVVHVLLSVLSNVDVKRRNNPATRRVRSRDRVTTARGGG